MNFPARRPVQHGMKAQHRWLLLPFGLALLPFARADVDVSISAEIRLGKVAAPPPPEVVVIDDSGPKGPPPWAPAHGLFKRNRAYYFYPGTNVYYRPSDRMWFYLEGRNWQVGVALPTSISVDFGRCVPLTMETDKPYEFHEKVVTYYPANYFTKKVKLKNEHHAGGRPEKAEKNKPGRDDDDEDRGKGKGKGKGKSKG